MRAKHPLLILGALGVVYGDIGTSPIYAFQACFDDRHGMAVTSSNVLGILSLIFWSLILVISLKYLLYVLPADNEGEGGIMALLAILLGSSPSKKFQQILTWVALVGSCLFFADSLITPAISVLSAVEGVQEWNPNIEKWVIPLAISILLLLFILQSFGSQSIGWLFGPIMVCWFITLALLGLRSIVAYPQVLQAIFPWHAFLFFTSNGWLGFTILSSVFLVVTGGEALYADMGHFGKSALRWGWFTLVLPGLLLNYLGQGALLLQHPHRVSHPFFQLAPEGLLFPFVLLSIMATVIASQAVISGVFSLTQQAMLLGYLPRLTVRHTSADTRGQIYIPFLNKVLALGTISLVIGFGSSQNLAAAYGFSVSFTMMLTSFLIFFVSCWKWKWAFPKALFISLPFLFIDIAFVSSNFSKLSHGGWLPLSIALVAFFIIFIWEKWRKKLFLLIKQQAFDIAPFLQELQKKKPFRPERTAVFLTGDSQRIPQSLLHNYHHNQIVHQTVLLTTITIQDVPRVSEHNRISCEPLGEGFFRVSIHAGFMENLDLSRILQKTLKDQLHLDPSKTSYFMGRVTVTLSQPHPWLLWDRRLFATLVNHAHNPSRHYQLSANDMIEVGMEIQI